MIISVSHSLRAYILLSWEIKATSTSLNRKVGWRSLPRVPVLRLNGRQIKLLHQLVAEDGPVLADVEEVVAEDGPVLADVEEEEVVFRISRHPLGMIQILKKQKPWSQDYAKMISTLYLSLVLVEALLQHQSLQHRSKKLQPG
jgi:hypothetical protein